MNNIPNPEEILQNILHNVRVGGNLTTGDITQILNLFVVVQQAENFQPIGIPHNIPHSATVKFVGRANAIERLYHLLLSNGKVVIAAIEGMGGIGKTELATQYALLHLLLSTYPGGICWLRARDENVGLQIVRFAEAKLGLKLPENWDLPKQVDFCWSNWTQGDVLVVLDDVNDYSKVESYLPPQLSRFKVLITTRLQLDIPLSITLDVLGEEAALDLVRQWIGEEKILQKLADAKKLCNRLGYLPLALTLVGRYVNKRKLPLEEMLRRLEEKGLEHPSLDVDKNDRTRTLKIERGVAAAFELNWEELSDNAKRLGCFLSLFALATIPWELVENVNIGQEPEELEDAKVELESLHLLLAQEDTYLLHQLIREFFQKKLVQLNKVNELKQAFATVIVTAARKIPNPDSFTVDIIGSIAPTVPHIAEAVKVLTDLLTDQDIIVSASSLGKFYQGQGFYDQAEFWFEQYLFLIQDRVGLDHPYIAMGLNNLGYLYYTQSRYAQAEVLYNQTLQLWQRWIKDDDAFIANVLNNLALLYDAQSQYSKAEPLFDRVLKIRQYLFGNEHLDVATSLNNLAAVYEAQKRYNKAEFLYYQALKLRKRLLGDNHPDVSQTLNNLAYLYYSQEHYSEAEPLYCQVLELDQRLLGKEHPNIASNLNNLAALYCAQGQYNKAEPLLEQALEMRRRLLGEEHTYVAESLNNLAALYSFQGRYSNAQQLYLQSLDIREQQLGIDHPQTIFVLNNFALFLKQAVINGRTDLLKSLPDKPLIQTILNLI